VTSLLAEFNNSIIENIILPKSSTLVIIRFKHQGYDDPQEVEGAYAWRTYKEITMSSSYHKYQTTIGPVLSDIKKMPYL
jgi:hypothetical protein